MSRSSLVVSLSLVLVLLSSSALAGEFKAAWVDLQRAVSEVDEGLAAKEQLKVLIDQKQKAFEKDRAVLQAEDAALVKLKDAGDQKAVQVRGEALQKKVYELGQRNEQSRQEVAVEERKKLDVIFGRMQVLLGEISAREDLAMVFDRASGIAWAKPALDITNEVIRTYNARFPVKSAKKKTDAPKK